MLFSLMKTDSILWCAPKTRGAEKYFDIGNTFEDAYGLMTLCHLTSKEVLK